MKKYFIPWKSTTNIQFYQHLFERLGYIQADSFVFADLLVLTGGADLGKVPERDSIETLAYWHFSETEKPVVGICRGFQLVGVLHSKNLITHIPDLNLGVEHTTKTEHWTGESNFHETSLGLRVNSRHHQGFLELPKSFEILDTASDGIIESCRFKNFFGVQWHPELPEMLGTDALDWFYSEFQKLR